MSTLSLDAIYTHLKNKKYNPQMQPSTQQVYCMLQIGGKEFPLFFRIYDEGHLLQLITFIPCPSLQPQLMGDMARLLHLLNKELDVPGFGMDETAGAIFYRFMLPTPHKKFEGPVIDAFIKTFEQVCSTFAMPIQAVALGATTLDEILAKAKQAKQ